MGIFNFLMLFALISNISADNATTNRNTIETTSISTAITIKTTTDNIDTEVKQAATAEPDTATFPPQNQSSATENDEKQPTTYTDEKQPTTTSQPTNDRDVKETATCALDQPHEDETTPAKPTPEATTPTVTEPPRKPSLRQRMKFHEHNHILSDEETDTQPEGPTPCTCGVFLSGQFKRGSKEPPRGLPVLTQEMDSPFMNNAMGNRQCTNKCLELIIKHLPKSGEIICATVDREHVFKERAYLFIKNHSDKWHGTNLSAGREFCCKENVPYKCPVK